MTGDVQNISLLTGKATLNHDVDNSSIDCHKTLKLGSLYLFKN
jgi:hypothetical protein